MADVNANIGVNIDTSAALAQLKSLQRQISQFHTSISKSSESAAIAQKSLQKNLLSSINAVGAFSAELRTVKTSAESFTSSLEGNKFSMREYFRYAGASTKTFGKLFRSEFDTIGRVAEERVKTLQTQYIKMGRNASGAMEAIAIRPTSLDMQDYGTRTAMAAQKQALFNQLMKQGSTNLLNFGKNTQWAGRQLMVGFTIPLTVVGSAATKTFMDMEAQAIKFKKVYGDLFTPKEETQQALDNITELGKSFTQYGIAVSTTVGLAAEAAAAGFSGLDLQRQTTEATRLSILGQIDTQKALETTISLQNAFGMSSENLAESIDFLNAVENQTVVSLDDITTAIPKVAPVIQQLGGDVKDLTFFMAAMKEGGINASEGANALKSGLAALINPTGRANEMLKSFGINAKEIVTSNKGDLKATVIEFATALNQLDPLNRAQAIEQMFGKFQFARLSALFANVTKEGNQASRVLALANSSVEELASLSEQELGMTAESSMNKFKKAVEDLKVALIPVGKAFLEAVTPILEFVGNILEKFGNLSDGTKKVITLITLGIAGLGPIFLMTFGLLANLLANSLKGAMILRNGYLRLTGQSQILGEQTQYLTMEQLDATAAAHSLDQSHARLTQQFTAEASAVAKLIAAYQQATVAGQKFMLNNPGMMLPGARKGYANGVISVPGSGNKDTVPAMLTPGEAVIPAAMAKRYAPLIEGMIAGNIPGYRKGRSGRDASSGELAQRNVIGGYDLSHIGGIAKKTGEELIILAEKQSQGVRQYVKSLIESSSSGINGIFDVLDNRITVQSKELNSLVGETGSGKKAPISLFKRDAVERSGAFNAPLLVKMDEAGATTEELKNAVSQVTKEIEDGLDKLGDQTTITAEEIDNLVKRAYENVGKTNEQVKSAYEKMQDPGALKETAKVAGSRGRKSFKGGYNLPSQKSKVSAMVEQMSPGTYPSQQAFVFTGNEARKVGVENAEELALLYDKLDTQAKQRVQKFLGNIKAMSEQVVAEAKAAGIRIGESVPVGIAVGAKTASPSKDTIKTGEDIGKGLEIGMQSRKDEVAAAGTDLGKTATQSTSRGARSTGVITPGQPYGIEKTQGGITMSQVTGGMPANPEVAKKAVEQARVMQAATDRIKGLDRNIMGASFAISSLSGIASMSGGKLGEMSGVIAKVTGAMFALQAVTGLLTSTNAVALVQKRLEIAQSAGANAMAAGPMFGGLSKAISGRAGLAGIIGRVGIRLAAFLGPVGMAVAAIGTVYGAFKFFKKRSDDAAFAAEGLAKAMTLSKDKVKLLGELLGQTPTARAGSGARVSANQLDANEQSDVDELRSNETFLKEYKDDIRAMREATDAEASLAFSSIAIDLAGQGFSEKAIKTYIDALGEESGKTEVALKFKQIDLSSKSGKKTAVNLAKDVTKQLDKEFKGKLIPLPVENNLDPSATATSKINLGKEEQKALNISAAALANTLAGLTGEFGNQTIKADEYNSMMLEIANSIPQGTLGMMLMDKMMTNINPEFAKATAGVKDYDTKMLLLRASLLNASVAEKLLQDLLSKNPDKVAAAKAELEKYRKVTDAMASQVTPTLPYEPPSDPAAATPTALSNMQDKIKSIREQAVAYNKLRASGASAKVAADLSADSLIAAAVAANKIDISKGKWKDLVKQLKAAEKQANSVGIALGAATALTDLKQQTKDINIQSQAYSRLVKAGFDAKKAEELVNDVNMANLINNPKLATLNFKQLKTVIDENSKSLSNFDVVKDPFANVKKSIEAFSQEFDKAMEHFTIQEAQISQRFNPLVEKYKKAVDEIQDKINEINKNAEVALKPLNDESTILSNSLSIIDNQSTKINEKYDLQASALQKISDINSEIASQQKQQLTLADALSQGDISAAAAAAQDMRASAAQNALGQQTGSIEAARKKELDALLVNGMTRAQIEERQYDISQLTYGIEQKRNKELDAQNIKLEAAQKIYDDNQKQFDAALKVITDQKIQWEAQKLIVDALPGTLTDVNGILKTQEAAVLAIAKAWGQVASAQGGGSRNATTGATTGTQGGGGGLTEEQRIIADLTDTERRMFGFAKGGLVPKYFAAGGLSKGTDIIPAMLTPGEFVMRKSAVDKFGPMLSAINDPSFKMPKSSSYDTSSSGINSVVDNSSAMYNYNIGITVPQSNANPNDIANAVIGQIKYIDAQRIRGQK
jgi:TP901 family phage tail tape measure protein